MSEELKPREKALAFGINSLTDTELLALILKTSYRDSSVLQLSKQLIELANGFGNLPSLTYEELISLKGIKQAKALELMAILEVARRLSKVDHISEPELSSPAKVVDWLRFTLGYGNQEEFFVIYLNGRGTVLKAETMYKGNANSANVSVDEILRRAILNKARNILVAHNHPSGDVEPSQADIELTKKLNEAAKMMNIGLLDHIIIGKSSYFSFKNYSMLK